MKKLIPILLLVIFFIAAAWYSLMRSPDPVHELSPPSMSLEPAMQEPPPEPDPVVMVDEEPTPPLEPLPPLQESDGAITSALAELAGGEAPVQYLVKDQVISRLVAVIDSLDARQVPLQVNPFQRPEGQFITAAEGERLFISPDNSSRYDGYVSLFQQLDARALARVYRRYYPLFQQAWQENGGEGPFHARLLGVIDHLSATPEVEGGLELIKPEDVYLYADPELEALTAGQKILLRMGSDNAAVVKAKLAEIKALLGK